VYEVLTTAPRMSVILRFEGLEGCSAGLIAKPDNVIPPAILAEFSKDLRLSITFKSKLV